MQFHLINFAVSGWQWPHPRSYPEQTARSNRESGVLPGVCTPRTWHSIHLWTWPNHHDQNGHSRTKVSLALLNKVTHDVCKALIKCLYRNKGKTERYLMRPDNTIYKFSIKYFFSSIRQDNSNYRNKSESYLIEKIAWLKSNVCTHEVKARDWLPYH